MKNLFLTFACMIGLLGTSCNQKTDTSKNDTVVIVNGTEKDEAAKNPETAKPTPPAPLPKAPVDYSAQMNEYHDILCRTAKRKMAGQPINIDDSLRLAELKMELDKIGNSLSGDDKTKFNFAMARANNMQSCP